MSDNFESLKIKDRVRLVTQGGAVEGRLAGVERDEQTEQVTAVLIRTLSARDIGSLYFTVAEIVENGWSLTRLPDPVVLPIEAAVQAVA